MNPNRGQKWSLFWQRYDLQEARSSRKIRISLEAVGSTAFEQPSSTVLGRNVAHSDLVEIAKRNGDFKKNYGVLVGAIL